MTLTLLSARTAPLPGDTPAQRLYSVANPTAGADWTVTVPVGEGWRVQTARAAFVADGTVVTRLLAFSALFGANVVFQAPIPSTVAASGQVLASSFIGAGFGAAGILAESPLPDVTLLPGSTFMSGTVNIQSGDQWSAITFSVLVYT